MVKPVETMVVLCVFNLAAVSVIADNAFLVKNGQPCAEIITRGTVPVVTLVSFGPKLPLHRPEGWLERSRLWLANNRYCQVTECYRDLAASTRDFATREGYESNKARWLMGRDADALEPYMDWDLPPPRT